MNEEIIDWRVYELIRYLEAHIYWVAPIDGWTDERALQIALKSACGYEPFRSHLFVQANQLICRDRSWFFHSEGRNILFVEGDLSTS